VGPGLLMGHIQSTCVVWTLVFSTHGQLTGVCIHLVISERVNVFHRFQNSERIHANFYL